MSELGALQKLNRQISKKIVGQEKLVNRLLLALLADGHLLVEGAPGLAKTRAVKVLASCMDADFHRVQFTPDLLPADLTGTDIYRQETGAFEFQPGPLFHSLVLADEVNRAPAKVQSALLEAMAERQITVGKKTHYLKQLFLVMATQNPIEQEGTYPLPEAQLDRFLLHVCIDYPGIDEEEQILQLARKEARMESDIPAATRSEEGQASLMSVVSSPDSGEEEDDDDDNQALSQQSIFAARREVLDVYMADNVERYILHLVQATRDPSVYGKELEQLIQYGASPRGTIALDRCARAHAWLMGKDYVDPEDVQEVLHDVLSHRLILHFEAETSGLDSRQVISKLVEHVPVP
ncbi:MAG: AAA family ATPase [Candidatus Eutrophobiaceae bacterium]